MSRETVWRKSSRSQNGPNCVEVATTLDQLRDSKNPHGPTLAGNVPMLTEAIQTGEFDR